MQNVVIRYDTTLAMMHVCRKTTFVGKSAREYTTTGLHLR